MSWQIRTFRSCWRSWTVSTKSWVRCFNAVFLNWSCFDWVVGLFAVLLISSLVLKGFLKGSCWAIILQDTQFNQRFVFGAINFGHDYMIWKKMWVSDSNVCLFAVAEKLQTVLQSLRRLSAPEKVSDSWERPWPLLVGGRKIKFLGTQPAEAKRRRTSLSRPQTGSCWLFDGGWCNHPEQKPPMTEDGQRWSLSSWTRVAPRAECCHVIARRTRPHLVGAVGPAHPGRRRAGKKASDAATQCLCWSWPEFGCCVIKTLWKEKLDAILWSCSYWLRHVCPPTWQRLWR